MPRRPQSERAKTYRQHRAVYATVGPNRAQRRAEAVANHWRDPVTKKLMVEPTLNTPRRNA